MKYELLDVKELLNRCKQEAYTNPKPADITDVEHWRCLFCKHHDDVSYVRESMVKLYLIQWDQGNEILKKKLKIDSNYTDVEFRPCTIGLM